MHSIHAYILISFPYYLPHPSHFGGKKTACQDEWENCRARAGWLAAGLEPRGMAKGHCPKAL